MKLETKTKNEVFLKNIAKLKDRSVELVKKIIEANSLNIAHAVEKNKTLLDKLRDKLIERKMDVSLIDSLYKTMVSSVLAAEQMIDLAIENHFKSTEQAMNAYLKTIKQFNWSDFNDLEKAEYLQNIMFQNFESSITMADDILKNQVSQFNKHANFTLNFNRNYSESIHQQMDMIQDISAHVMINNINNWVMEWNKQTFKDNKDIN